MVGFSVTGSLFIVKVVGVLSSFDFVGKISFMNVQNFSGLFVFSCNLIL